MNHSLSENAGAFLRLKNSDAPTASWREAVRRAHESGYQNIILETDESLNGMREVARACREYSVSLSLDVSYLMHAAPDEPQAFIAQSLFFEVSEISERDFAAPTFPSMEGELLGVVAVPLLGESRAADWKNSVFSPSLPSLDFAGDEVVGARLYFMLARDDAAVSTQTFAFFDALDAQATRNAIEGHLQPVRAHLGDDWNVVSALLLPPPMAGRAQDFSAPDSDLRFAWSHGFADAFRRLHGVESLPLLPALVANTGDDAVRVRTLFHKTVAHLIRENWWDVLHHWGGQNGVTMLVSLGERDSPARVLESCGNVETLLSAGAKVIAPHSPQGTLHARRAASWSALQGDEYSAMNALSRLPEEQASLPSQQKRCALALLADGIFAWEEASGCAALPPLSTQKMPRAVAPQLHQPEGALHRDFAKEIEAVAAHWRQAKNGARVAVLWPSQSLQSHYNPRGHRFTRWVEDDLRVTQNLLDKLHFDFLFIGESALCEAEMEGAQFTCGAAQHRFSLLVLPGITTLSRASWEKIEAFCKSGGRVVCLGLLPRWSEIGRDEELEERILRAARFHVADVYDSYAATDKARRKNREAAPVTVGGAGFSLAREYSSGGRLVCYQPRLNADPDDALLVVRRALMESLPAVAESQEREVRIARRIAEDGSELFLVANNEEARRVPLRLKPETQGVPMIFDAQENRWRALPLYMPFSEDEGGGLALTWELQAGEARLLRIAPRAEYSENTANATSAANAENTANAERANFVLEEMTPHIARGYATESGVPTLARRAASGKIAWHRGENVEVPSPMMLPDLWNARRDSPNALRLESESGVSAFHLHELVEPLFIAVRGAKENLSTQAFWNEGALARCENPYSHHALWRDEKWQWFAVRGARVGENVLRLENATQAFLLGEFAPHENENWWENEDAPQWGASHAPQISSGPWREQGMPHYVGAVEYSQDVFVPAEWENCRVFLEIASRENVLEVCVGDVKCGRRSALPFRFEVTQAMRFGSENSVMVRVIGDASPVLSEDPSALCGFNGMARLAAYPRVEIQLQEIQLQEE